jgi:peptidoglycan/xylan/chitin deacetylase (PgdA/CDA1 family)
LITAALHYTIRIFGDGVQYIFKSSNRSDVLPKLQRSIACLQFLVQSPIWFYPETRAIVKRFHSWFKINNLKRLVVLFVSCGYFGLNRIRKTLLHLIGKRTPGTCVVLRYHGIPSEQRRQFAEQLDSVLKWAKPLRADSTVVLADNSRYAAVTFDDGHISFLENALPELEKRQIPAAVFVVSEKLGQYPDWANFSTEPLTNEGMMTADQLREISDRVVIGSHTMTHPVLTQLSEDDAMRELKGSRQALEQILGKKIALFSFPYGAFNQNLVDCSRKAGYERIFTNLPVSSLVDSHEFLAGRVPVEPTDWTLEFRLKLAGAYQWLPLAFAVKRKLYFMFNGARTG